MAKELGDKITSEEELLNLIGSSSIYQDQKARAGQALGLTRHATLWWAAREHRRISSGFYEVTEVLAALNTHGPYYAHVSKEDRNMVAFTPDKAAGEADRQIRMTIGRLLSKIYTIASDNWIAEQVASHTAELTNEVDWLEGGAIAEAYKVFGGIGACMTSEKFNNAKYHPASVYDAPGIKLAYLKDKEGKFTARSLVYEASETDKRFIRCFPAGSILQKRLERLGYKAGTFEGAKLKTIFTKTDDALASKREVVIPYIDGLNTYGSVNHSTVIVLDGQLQVLQGFQVHFVAGFCATKTEGSALVPVHTAASLNPVCMLSGRVINVFSGERTTKFFKGGVAGAIDSNLAATMTAGTYRMILPNGETQVVLAAEEDTLLINGRRYLNHKETLAANGLAKLDIEWYPELQEGYVSQYNSRMTEDSRVCKPEDTVVFINAAGLRVVRHKTQIPGNATKLHSNKKDELAFADASLPVLKTVTGRKVHLAYNAVAVPCIGKLDFTRNLKELRVLGAYRLLTKPDALRVEKFEMWPELCEVVMAERYGASEADGWLDSHTYGVGGLAKEIGNYENACGGRHNYSSEITTHFGAGLRYIDRLGGLSFSEAERLTWMIISEARAGLETNLRNAYGHTRTVSLKTAKQHLALLSHHATRVFSDAGAVEYPNRAEAVVEVSVEEVLSAQATTATVELVNAQQPVRLPRESGLYLHTQFSPMISAAPVIYGTIE